MKLRIVGDAAEPAPRDEWPEPLTTGGPRVLLHDARGGGRDRALLEGLRAAGHAGEVLLAVEGAPRDAPLPPELGPGRMVRGHGPALVLAVQRAGGAPLAVGGAAARAFAGGLRIRVDPGLRAGALPPMLRGVPVDLTLREGWPSVLMALLPR